MKLVVWFGFLATLVLAVVVPGMDITTMISGQSNTTMAYAASIKDDMQHPPPLRQLNDDGVPLYNIQCNEPKELYINESQIPVCIHPDTYQILSDRGMVLLLPPTPESVLEDVITDSLALYDSDPDTAFATINSGAVTTEYAYPFVIDSNEIILAHGFDESRVGIDHRVISTTERPLEEIRDDLQKNNKVWVNFSFVDPSTGYTHHNTALIVAHDGYAFGAGYLATTVDYTSVNATDVVMSYLELTEEETAWLQEHDTIRITYNTGWAPLEYEDESGNLAGVMSEYAKEFSKQTGSEFVGVVSASMWDDVAEMIRDDKADVMFSIIFVPERLEYVNYTSTHYTIDAKIITLDDRQLDSGINEPGLKLLTIEGNGVGIWLDENHPDVDYLVVDNFADAYTMLDTGEADALAATWPVASYHALQSGITMIYDAGTTGYEYELKIGYSNDNPILGSILQKTLDNIPASQIAKWYEDAVTTTSPPLELTEEETAWLQEHDTIRITYNTGWAPLEYEDESGNLAGVMSEYAKEFSKQTGSEFVGVVSASMWDDVAEMIRDDKADVMFSIIFVPERLEYVNYTSTHYTIDAKIITLDDRQLDSGINEPGLKLLTIEGYDIATWLDENHPDVDYLVVDNFADAYTMLDTGEADALAATWPVASYHALQSGITMIYDAGTTGYEYELNIGYSNDNPILGSILQKTLDNIPASQIAKWYEDAVTTTSPPLELTEEETAWLQEHDTIRITYNTGWAPLEYEDESGNLAGVMSEYAKEFSKQTGSEFAGAESAAIWDDVAEMIRDDKADVMFSIIFVPERLEYVNYTSTHYTIDAKIITLDDRQLDSGINEPGLKLLTIEGYDIATWLDENHPDVDYLVVDNFADAYTMLDTGEADALAATWPVASYHALQSGITMIYDAGTTGYEYELKIGYSNDNPILGSILQKTLDNIPASQIAKWYEDAVN